MQDKGGFIKKTKKNLPFLKKLKCGFSKQNKKTYVPYGPRYEGEDWSLTQANLYPQFFEEKESFGFNVADVIAQRVNDAY